MYGGLPTQYNPHSTRERDANLLQTLADPAKNVCGSYETGEMVWDGKIRAYGDILWSYAAGNPASEGVS